MTRRSYAVGRRHGCLGNVVVVDAPVSGTTTLHKIQYSYRGCSLDSERTYRFCRQDGQKINTVCMF